MASRDDASGWGLREDSEVGMGSSDAGKARMEDAGPRRRWGRRRPWWGGGS